MKLTEKAFKDFEMWLENQEVASYKVIFPDIPVIIQNSYIIEWFDSVSIYIGIIRYNVGSGYFESRIHYQGGIYFTSISRQEATNKAIEKANEIYNKL